MEHCKHWAKTSLLSEVVKFADSETISQTGRIFRPQHGDDCLANFYQREHDFPFEQLKVKANLQLSTKKLDY